MGQNTLPRQLIKRLFAGAGIDGSRGNAFQTADFAGQRADHVVRRVNHHADDIDLFRAVGNSHPADDIIGIVVQNFVQAFDGIAVFDDDGDNGYFRFHEFFLFFKQFQNQYHVSTDTGKKQRGISPLQKNPDEFSISASIRRWKPPAPSCRSVGFPAY